MEKWSVGVMEYVILAKGKMEMDMNFNKNDRNDL